MTGQLSSDIWRLADKVSTATLTTQLLRRGVRSTFLSGLRPTRPDLRMAGHAFTLRYAPARDDVGTGLAYDNATNPQRVAAETVADRQVLVIDARGEVGAASFGHILATRIAVRGAAGLVTDGAIRDSPSFHKLDLPVYSAAAHATTSATLHHPVDIQVPIGCAGVLVEPGDVLIGDQEGVVVIPQAMAAEVITAADEQESLEEYLLQRVEGGAPLLGTYPPDSSMLQAYMEWRDGNSK